jgi:hypothetical protein
MDWYDYFGTYVREAIEERITMMPDDEEFERLEIASKRSNWDLGRAWYATVKPHEWEILDRVAKRAVELATQEDFEKAIEEAS